MKCRRMMSALLAVIMCVGLVANPALAVNEATVSPTQDITNGFYEDGTYQAAVLRGGFYEISNAGQLYWFAQQVNGGQTAINAKLVADLVVNEGNVKTSSTSSASAAYRAWTPIGTTSAPYAGIFDGNGHSISGLYCYNTQNSSRSSLFESSQGTIQDLTLSNSFFYSSNSVAASLCAFNEGTIENCSADANVADTAGDASGLVYRNDTTGLISGCTFSGIGANGGICNLNMGLVTNCSNASRQVYNGAGICVANMGEIRQCTNHANIIYDTGMAAGICSYNERNGIIADCVNEGKISGRDYGSTAVYYNDAGGICARNYGMIERCGNLGTLHVDGTYGSVGGIAGWHHSNALGDNAIRDCYNTGDIELVGTNQYGGGICGSSDSLIQGCYSTGTGFGGTRYGHICGHNCKVSVSSSGTVLYYHIGKVDSCLHSGSGSFSAVHTADTDTVKRNVSAFGSLYSGSAAYALNGYRSGVTGRWYQNIDNGETQDAYPVLDDTHGVVYAVGNSYTNTAPEAPSGDVIASGGINSGNWTLDKQGVLTITDCTSIPSVTPGGAPWYRYRDQIKTVIMPAYGSSRTIGDYAFYNCANLTSVQIDDIYTIGQGAFARCTALPSIYISTFFENVRMTIGAHAFYGCTALETVSFPNYSTVNPYAFEDCTALTSIYLNSTGGSYSSLTVETDGFYDVNATLYYPEGISKPTLNSEHGGTIALQSTYTGPCGFDAWWTLDPNAGILTVSGTGALSAHSSGNNVPWSRLQSELLKAVVEEGITDLPSYTFEYCGNMHSIELPYSLKTMGFNAFNDCSSLNDLLIPPHVTAVEGNFNRCSALMDVYYLGTQEEWNLIENAQAGVDSQFNPNAITLHVLKQQGAEATCTEGGLELHYSFEGPLAYPDLYDAQKQVMTSQPAAVPALGHNWEFTADLGVQKCGRCGETNNVGLPSGTCGQNGDNLTWTLTDDGTLVISGTGKMASYDYNGTKLPWAAYCDYIKAIELGDGVTSIGSYAFNGCSLVTTLEIAAGITEINSSAFKGCTGLTGFTVDSANTAFRAVDGVVFSADNRTVVAYPTGRTGEYVIPSGTTLGGNSKGSAFDYAQGLTKVTIPDGLQFESYGAFNECVNLKEVCCLGDFPFESVFMTVGSSVMWDGSHTFRGVTATVYYPEGNSTWTGSKMVNMGGTITYVPYTPSTPSVPDVPFAGGSGTVSDPYQVATAQQLDHVRQHPDAHFIQTANIDLNGIDWVAIGTEDEPFNGTYDGNGNEIYNLTIDVTTAYADAATHTYGLFGVCGSDSEIARLTVNCYIDVEYTDHIPAGSSVSVGAVCGVTGGELWELVVNGSVNVSDRPSVGTIYVGGIAGKSSDLITECTNNATLQGGAEFVYMGGIVGSTTGNITHCETASYVMITVRGAMSVYAGGICGSSEYPQSGVMMIENCTNRACINATAGSDVGYVGGIVGYTSGGCTDCENANGADFNHELVGSAAELYIGGIAAYSLGKMLRCTNSGPVRADTEACYGMGTITAGGICAVGTAEGCTNSGSVSATGQNYAEAYGIAPTSSYATAAEMNINRGNVTAYSADQTGRAYGIARSNVRYGINYGAVHATGMSAYACGIGGNTHVESSCNLGDVTAVAKAYEARAAGISHDATHFSKVANAGDVYACDGQNTYAAGISTDLSIASGVDMYNAGAVKAEAFETAYAGGILACLNGNGDLTPEYVKNAYNLGKITATSGQGAAYAGALVAYTQGRDDQYNLLNLTYIHNGYYLTGSAAAAVSNDDGGVALSGYEMTRQASFAGFDFNNVWSIDPEADYPFPVLQGLDVTMPKVDVDVAPPQDEPCQHVYEVNTYSWSTDLEQCHVGLTCTLCSEETEGHSTYRICDVAARFDETNGSIVHAATYNGDGVSFSNTCVNRLTGLALYESPSLSYQDGDAFRLDGLQMRPDYEYPDDMWRPAVLDPDDQWITSAPAEGETLRYDQHNGMTATASYFEFTVDLGTISVQPGADLPDEPEQTDKWANVYWNVLEDGMLGLKVNNPPYELPDTDGDQPWADQIDRITSVLFVTTKVIGQNLLEYHHQLIEATLPYDLAEIRSGAFRGCAALREITFWGEAPVIAEDAFAGVTATVYYPADDETWTEEVRRDYGGDLTWVADGGCVDSGTLEEGIYWELDSEGTLTIYGQGAIPDYPGESPWAGYENIIRVRIKHGITRVGDHALRDMPQLKAVTMADSVTELGDHAFASCYELSEVKLSGNLTTMGSFAFYWDESLEEVKIPDTVVTIGEFAFAACGLTKIAIPAGVTWIGGGAFTYSGRLTELTVAEDNSAYTAKDNVLYTKNLIEALHLCPASVAVGEYTVADGVSVIAPRAFQGCYDLTSVTIPASVADLGGNVFVDCSSLEEIWFRGDAPAFQDFTFFAIEATAYYPAGNETWTEYVRQNYEGNITWVPYSEAVDSGTWGDIFWSWDGEGTLTISGEGAVPGVDEFAGTDGSSDQPWSEYMQSITKVVLEEGITGIGQSAFMFHQNLTEVTLPSTLESIGVCAFAYCSSLQQIALPENLKTLANFAFDASGLTSVRIPASVETIGMGVFEFCNSLHTVVIDAPIRAIPDKLFYYSQALPGFEIPRTVETIGAEAFANCTALAELTIPDSVTAIGSLAFESCTSLKTVTFEGSAPVIAEDAFAATNAPVVVTAYYPAGNETWTEEVRRDYGGDLTWVAYTVTVASGTIGETLSWTLDSAGTLTISGEGEMPNFSWDFENTPMGHPWYDYRELIRKVVIEEGITRIGECAFYRHIKLTDVEIPASVTVIGNYAFGDCGGLTDVAFPEGLTNINDYAFYNCDGLTTLDVPDLVYEIGQFAFCGCDNLVTVDVGSGIGHLAPGCFIDCPSLQTIWVNAYESQVMHDGCSFSNAEVIFLPEEPGEFTWSYDEATCTLTISGSGESVLPIENPPWQEYVPQMRTLVIGDGIAELGAFAFDPGMLLEKIYLSKDVKRLSTYAFDACMAGEAYFRGDQPEIMEAGVTQPFAGKPDTAVCYTAFKDWDENAWTNCIFRAVPGIILEAGRFGIRHLRWVADDSGTLSVFGYSDLSATMTLADETIMPWSAYAESIRRVAIPAQVTEIGAGVFDSCTGLKTVYIDSCREDVTLAANAFAEGVAVRFRTCRTHSFGSGKSCTFCGADKCEALGHDFGDVQYHWDADYEFCTATRTCRTDAAHTETAHASVTSAVAVPATCFRMGTTSYAAVFKETWATTQIKSVMNLATIAHTPASAVKENEKAATCYAEGSYDEVVYCAVAGCGHKISSTPKTAAKLAHTPADAVVEKEIAATCAAEGSYDSVVYCAVDACKQELSRKTVSVDKLEHSFEQVETEPTCELPGSVGYTCTVCEYHYDEYELMPTGHAYGAWITTKAPTSDEEGEEMRVCANDPSHVEKRAIKILPLVSVNNSTGRITVELLPDGASHIMVALYADGQMIASKTGSTTVLRMSAEALKLADTLKVYYLDDLYQPVVHAGLVDLK